MKNFDYLKDKPDFAKLYQFCNSTEINQSIGDVQKLFDYTMDKYFN